ncbi:MAG: hypothetical protein N3I35_16885 [Clostridia bacterium]|nr:hypothetical protein [Clostridia bacterium]
MDNTIVPKKKCSFCGEDIDVGLSRCPYCGSLLDFSINSSVGCINNNDQAQTNNNYSGEPEVCGNVSNSLDGECLKNVMKSDDGEPLKQAVEQTDVNNRHHNTVQNSNTQIKQNLYIINDDNGRKPLGNGLKVFLTVISTVIPGFGQILGIIISIVLMNSEDEKYGTDKKSFGLALLVSSLVMFVLSCISCFILLLAFSVPFEQ